MLGSAWLGGVKISCILQYMRHVTCLKPWFRDDTLRRVSCCCSLSPPKLFFSRPLKICKFRVFCKSYIYTRAASRPFLRTCRVFFCDRHNMEYFQILQIGSSNGDALARPFFSRGNIDRFANLSPCAAKSVMEIGLFTREHQLACSVVSIKIGLFARDHHTNWPGRSRSSHKLARSLAIIIII